MTSQPTSYGQPVQGQYPPHMRHPNSMMVQQGAQHTTYGNGAPPPYAGASPYSHSHMAGKTPQTPHMHPSQPVYQVQDKRTQ